MIQCSRTQRLHLRVRGVRILYSNQSIYAIHICTVVIQDLRHRNRSGRESFPQRFRSFQGRTPQSSPLLPPLELLLERRVHGAKVLPRVMVSGDCPLRPVAPRIAQNLQRVRCIQKAPFHGSYLVRRSHCHSVRVRETGAVDVVLWMAHFV